MAGFFELINDGRRQDQHASDQEVGQVSDKRGRCSLDYQLDQFLDKLYQNARDRSEGKARDHGRELREVQLVEGRGDHRKRKVKTIQYSGNSGEHADHDNLAGGEYPLCSFVPRPRRFFKQIGHQDKSHDDHEAHSHKTAVIHE
jgi:hypothetical protein